MRSFRGLRWTLAVFVLALSDASAPGQDATEGSPLVQVSFARLVPISYPVVHPRFDRLRPTTDPIIHPGVPQVHITSNLTDAFAEPLLHPYPYWSASAYPYGTTLVSAAAKTASLPYLSTPKSKIEIRAKAADPSSVARRPVTD